jgi:hypothetical protein
MHRLWVFVSDVITSDGNVSNDVGHDASFYGVQMCGWMSTESQIASMQKTTPRHFCRGAVVEA